MDAENKHNIQQDIQDLNEKIDDLTEIAEENQRMVKNLYQRARMATVVVFIKWFLIIAIFCITNTCTSKNSFFVSIIVIPICLVVSHTHNFLCLNALSYYV